MTTLEAPPWIEIHPADSDLAYPNIYDDLEWSSVKLLVYIAAVPS